MNNVAALLHSAAVKYPTRTALRELESHVSYSELLEKVCGVAFISSDAAEGRLSISEIHCVGIIVEEGIELVVSMLCCYFLNVPFVTLDRRWPAERIRYLIKECNVTHIIGTLEIATTAQEITLSHGDCDKYESRREVRPSYYATTSGTTGFPKVLPVTDAQICESASCKVSEECLSPESVILLASHFTFDPCHVDIIAAILAGSCLVVPPRAEITSSKLPEVVRKMRISHICCTPTHWKIFISSLAEGVGPESYPNLKCVSLGGEQFPRELLSNSSEWSNSKIIIRNTFGLTEAVGYQSSVVINDIRNKLSENSDYLNGYIPIGNGMGSYNVTVTETGEIKITGKYTSPILTGDYGIISDGLVMISGSRRDSKIKLRGVLVDMLVTENQISAGIAQHLGLTDIRCFLLKESQTLCCCLCFQYQFSPDAQAHISHLISYQCSTVLIQQAIPVQFSFVATSSFGELLGTQSKISDSQIADLHTSKWGSAVVGELPTTGLQIIISNAWISALSISERVITVEDNFFSLGGDSITALRAVRYIEDHTTQGKYNSDNKPAGEGGEERAFKSIAGMLIDKENRDEQICNLKDLMGPFAPCELISRPVLCDYEEYLISQQVTPLDDHKVLHNIIPAAPRCDKLEDAISFVVTKSLIGKDSDAADSVRLLLQQKVSSHSGERVEWGLLHCCIAYRRPKLFSEIIGSGFYSLEQLRSFSLLGHLAAGKGDAESLRQILNSGWYSTEDQDEGSQPPQSLSSLLLETDADGCTILHIASRGGSITCIRMLVELAASTFSPITFSNYLDQKDGSLMSPVQWGVSNGNFKCSKALVSAGATPLVRKAEPVQQMHDKVIETTTGDEEDYGRVRKGIRKATKYLAHRKVEKDNTILEELISQLSCSDEKVVEESLATIRNLVCAVQTHRRFVLENDGAVKQIISLLWPPNRTASHAAGTIRNLATRVDSRSVLLKYDILPPLVKLLHQSPPSSDALWRAAAAIGSLAANTDTWEYLLSSGAAATIREMGARKLDLPEELLAQVPT